MINSSHVKITNKSGAFLLEVLLAVFILSISLTIIIGAMGSSVRIFSESHERVQALDLLERELQFVFLGLKEKDSTLQEGYLDERRKYYFNITIEPLIEKDNVYHLQAYAQWKSGMRMARVNLETLHFVPINEQSH